jgi:hypothetical protein
MSPVSPYRCRAIRAASQWDPALSLQQSRLSTHHFRPRSRRRPPRRSLCQVHAPQHRRIVALEDAAVMRLSASQDNAGLRRNSTPGISSRSVKCLRNMLESCDNRAGSAKRKANMFRCHAARPHVADAVIEASQAPEQNPGTDRPEAVAPHAIRRAVAPRCWHWHDSGPNDHAGNRRDPPLAQRGERGLVVPLCGEEPEQPWQAHRHGPCQTWPPVLGVGVEGGGAGCPALSAGSPALFPTPAGPEPQPQGPGTARRGPSAVTGW